MALGHLCNFRRPYGWNQIEYVLCDSLNFYFLAQYYCLSFQGPIIVYKNYLYIYAYYSLIVHPFFFPLTQHSVFKNNQCCWNTYSSLILTAAASYSTIYIYYNPILPERANSSPIFISPSFSNSGQLRTWLPSQKPYFSESLEARCGHVTYVLNNDI